MVKQSGELHLLPFPCCLTHTRHPLGHARLALCRVRARLMSVLLDQRPSLLTLRRRLSAIVRVIHRYSSAVRLLEGVRAGRTAIAFTRRPVAKVRFRRLRGLPVLVHGVSRRAWGSATTQGRPATGAGAAGRVAFRSGDGVGALIANFRSSIPSLSFSLFTLRWTLRSAQCKTRGRAGRYSFLVRLFHPQLHAGLSRRTTTFFSRHGLRSWCWSKIRMVSLPTRGTSLRFTASSAISRTVQRA